MCGVVADVSTPEGREILRQEVETRFSGKLDVLVNNVGTNIRKPTKDYTAEDYEFVMKVGILQGYRRIPHLCMMSKQSSNAISSAANCRRISSLCLS